MTRHEFSTKVTDRNGRCSDALDATPMVTDVTEAKRRTDGLYCERLDALAHEVIQSSVACMKGDRDAREKVFKRMLFAYTSIFFVGLVAFAAALAKGLMKDSDAATTAVFAGLSGISFVAIIVFRPLATLKRNSIALTWLNVVTTSYWTRHYDLNKRGKLGELEAATADTLAHLDQLLQINGDHVAPVAKGTDGVPPKQRAEKQAAPSHNFA